MNRYVTCMQSQVLTKAAGCAPMRKMQKAYSSRSMTSSVSVLSHASVTPNFKYSRHQYKVNLPFWHFILHFMKLKPAFRTLFEEML